ncbi:MAG: metallophosphoesterase, partial [Clostridia bacterium]
MIYITGDTHGEIDIGKLTQFAEANKNLSRSDYMIIAGDFGAVWNRETLDADLARYEKFPFSILFVDGNHENFDLLDAYPIEIWNGGKVHKTKESIIHLMRGQVFEIEGKKFFTFGGATSVDKCNRTEGKSWWPQENPCDNDIVEANKNLSRVGNKVDIIITHSIDEKALYYPPMISNKYSIFQENRILSYFEDVVEYKHWYFGHY